MFSAHSLWTFLSMCLPSKSQIDFEVRSPRYTLKSWPCKCLMSFRNEKVKGAWVFHIFVSERKRKNEYKMVQSVIISVLTG